MQKKVAIITGAGRGIGRAVALGLAKDGYKQLLIARTASELEGTAAEIGKITGSNEDAWISQLDVSDRPSVNKVIEQLNAKWKRVDLLFNNAGVFHSGSSDCDSAKLEEMMCINFTGAVNFMQAVIPIMRSQRSGSIINISSMAGKTPFGSTGGYSASKSALNGFSESLFRELAQDGINVTRICPSWVNTTLARGSSIGAEAMIQPEDVLESVRYLLKLTPGAMVPELVIYCRQTVK